MGTNKQFALLSYLIWANRMFSVRSANINCASRSSSLTRLLGYLISTGCTGTPGINAPSGQGRQRTDRKTLRTVSRF